MDRWAEAVAEIEAGLAADVAGARDRLRQLVVRACREIGAQEGSVLVPDEARVHLRFLVSTNPELDGADVLVRCDQSISGVVFNTGQLIEKEDPDTLGTRQVREITAVEPRILLAAPILGGGRTCGVANFVNRTPDREQVSFDRTEVARAEAFADLYAVALAAYQRAVGGQQAAGAALGRLRARWTGAAEAAGPAPRLLDRTLELVRALPPRDLEHLERFAAFLLADAEPSFDLGLDGL